MPGDYSRKTFDRAKHYSGVRMQQGRVQLDADWNAEHDIQNYRTEIEAIDVIGQSGVPKKDRSGNGFKVEIISGGRNLQIGPGRIYVEGLLCELDTPVTYASQPHFPNPVFTTPASPPERFPQFSLPNGIYLAYIDAWQREISALDDPLIREVALGGPDTTNRIQNLWQVKLLKVGEKTSPPAKISCRSNFESFDALTAPSTGRLKALTKPPVDEDSVCLLPPSAGYSRQENQLYRVEVHTGGNRNQATFKWSRDNASVETTIKSININVITVADLGRDEVLNFAGGQWVEIVDEESTLKGPVNALAEIDKIDPNTNEITMKTSVAAFAGRPGLKLRRWDQTGTNATSNGVSANLASAIDLEGGIQVEFENGQYHTGDYWLIPARTVTGDIEWPRDNTPSHNPISQLPRGIHHHFARLALIDATAGALTILEDCRRLFPPLTELLHFFYVGGGGQEAIPGQRLPCPLQVGLINDQTPVVGARVRFDIVGLSGGTLRAGLSTGTSVLVNTDADGIAECFWDLGELGRDRGRRCMQVEASLLGPGAQPLIPPIRFNANLSIASLVAYVPGNCDDLNEATNVQEALDILCNRKSQEVPGINIDKIITASDEDTLRNDTLVPVVRLEKGIIIHCDGDISAASAGGSPTPPSKFPDAVPAKPTCFVTLDLPHRSTRGDGPVVAFQPVIVAAATEARGKQIEWRPTSESNRWLQQDLFRELRETTDRVLAHLTLKGNFIFSPDSRIYLDGEGFGGATDDDRVEITLPSGNDQKAGDFEMWFWLFSSSPTVPPPVIVVTAASQRNIVRGSVKDGTGAAVSGVNLTITNTATGQTVLSPNPTNAQGDFIFPALPAGKYEISGQVSGVTFKQAVTIP